VLGGIAAAAAFRTGGELNARTREFLRPFFSCRLCWRITLSVFVLILVVEAAILVPSSRQFERNERKLLADQAQLHSLGTRVVAEGVEHEAQAKFLLERGCDEVQGYLYGWPVPAAEFERLYLLQRVAA
jgi:hypothetical protein